jgi:thiamine-phosphate pyrophosphorylase
MAAVAGEGGLTPRLFLVAPAGAAALQVIACVEAACSAGDVATLLLPPALVAEVTSAAQALNVAVLADGDAKVALDCDGVHLNAATQSITEARRLLGKERIVGAYAGASRHVAMEAGEDGADYVALSQHGSALGGENIIAWWTELFVIPCIAFDPVTAADLDILLPQNPDFIRPDDAMWHSPDLTRRIIGAISQRLAA